VTVVVHHAPLRPRRLRLPVAAAVAAWLGGSSLGCVDTSKPPPPGPLCQATSPVPFAGSATIPSEDTATPGPYLWKNVVIKGGGFVTGVVVSPALPGLFFARTDVGGAYRYDPANQRWRAITDSVGHTDVNLTGIESIAADPVDPNRVYVAAGTYLTAGNGQILSSTDMGQTWTRHNIPAPMGGNVDGRSMGERLAVDPNLTSTLYFGSRNAGLWKSADSAQTWTRIGPTQDINGTPALITGATMGGAGAGGTGYGFTFVLFDPRSGSPGSPTPTIYVGVGVITGTALYRSTDAGATWEAVAGQPPAGMMPHHAVMDVCGNLFLTYNNGSGPNGVTAGAVWRYATATGEWTDVSPTDAKSYGFGGVSADAANPGTLVVTTIDNWGAAEIYRTTSGGASWTPLAGTAERDVAGAPWLYWHTNSLPAMGWMGDVEIDPFNPDRAFFITGQGLWSSDDLTASDTGAATHWTFDDNGLEETVALDLASPPAGAPLLSGVGDIAGFKHDDLDVSPPAGIYSNPIFGNTASLDFAEAAAAIIVRVGTSSAVGGPRAAGAYSRDGGTTWTPFAAAPTTASASGSIAIAADGTSLVWAPASSRNTPVMAAYSLNMGTTWTPCAGLPAGARVAADRVNASKFYGSSGNRMYVSTDGGASFVPAGTATTGRPRPVFGIEGDLWITNANTTTAGLLHSQDSGTTFTTVPRVNSATAVGFGAPAPGQSYPAVYLAGSVVVPPETTAVWGIYRSDDGGATWQRIDDPQHQFGDMRCLTGDPRQYGRVYLGTGGRGVLYGDPRQQSQ
jgi:hypothetical protein